MSRHLEPLCNHHYPFIYETDAIKFYEIDKKAAGVWLRKGLQEIKTSAQALRLAVSNKNKKD